jgi:hypothetical protein
LRERVGMSSSAIRSPHLVSTKNYEASLTIWPAYSGYPRCATPVVYDAHWPAHSAWMDKLRDSTDPSGQLRKGIRDIMEHHPVSVNINHAKTGDEPWHIMASVGEPGSNASFRSDLIPTMKEIVADLANLWTEVCLAAELQRSDPLWVAPYGDAVLLTGNDDDSTGFWARI